VALPGVAVADDGTAVGGGLVGAVLGALPAGVAAGAAGATQETIRPNATIVLISRSNLFIITSSMPVILRERWHRLMMRL
jgi:hypothetical protein